MHVGDAARALVAIIDSHVSGPVNVASGEPVVVADIARTLERLLGGKVILGALPRRADDPDYIVADVARLREELGFRPHFNRTSGLRDVLEWLHTEKCS